MVAEKLPQMAGRKTAIWQILSTRNGGMLATVKWFAPWRQYVVEPAVGAVFNWDCLQEIAAFLNRKTAEHKARRKEEAHGRV